MSIVTLISFRPDSASMPTGSRARATVPVIDIASFVPASRTGDPRAGATPVVEAVERACSEIGFFTIVGHGVPASLVDRMHAVSRGFFDLPLEEKLAVKRPRHDQSRGYIGIGDENLAYSLDSRDTTDVKELFAIGPVDVP